MRTMTEIILYSVIYLYIFWVLFIAIMGCYRAHLDKRLIGVTKLLAYPLVIIGFTFDVICQYTIATVLFLDFANNGEYLVTSRLQRYVALNNGWRCKLANYICNNLLDVFDPSGNHC